jgi:rhodanese-related sulfurtransferase
MNAQQLAPRFDDYQVLDVRHPHEWEAGHIPGSVHLPLDQLGIHLDEVAAGRPLMLVCRSGPRSVLAATYLGGLGRQVDHLEGGVSAWSDAGLPFEASDGAAGRVVSPDLPRRADLPPGVRPAPGRISFATGPLRDLELAATVAATAEDLGYATVWIADGPEGDGVAAAAAMLKGTSAIRVGVGPIVVAPGAEDLLGRLRAAGLPPARVALALEGMDSPEWTAEQRQSTLSSLQEQLGAEWTLGVVALGEDTLRFGGEFADLVFLDWMTPERIAWARKQIALGATARAEGRAPVRVVGRVHAVLGEGASLRLSTEAFKYLAKPQYAASFAAMGSVGAGITAPDAPEAWALAEAYTAVLDELVIHPVVKLPTAATPTLGEVFYALSVLLEVAHAFAPAVPAEE